MKPVVRLSLEVSPAFLPQWCLLAGSGFTIRARTGCTLMELLCGELEIPAEYLHGRIQTIFLNASVVDDPGTTAVPAGSTIALSAAMPGIAGIMFRRSSPYAAMRGGITHIGGHPGGSSPRDSHVVLKLFNMLQSELGPRLLSNGGQVSGKALTDLLRGRSDTFRRGIVRASIDDAPVSPDVLFEIDWVDRNVFLQIGSGETGNSGM